MTIKAFLGSSLKLFSFVLLYFITLGNETQIKAQCGDTTNSAGQTCAITTAVPFLMIAPDSRSGALGEAGVAFADNANALYWNPSILPFSKSKMGFSVNYTPWLRALGIPDINHAFTPFYYNLGDKGGVIGASLTFFSLGEINLTDAVGNPIGKVNPSEYALSAYYSRKVTKKLGVGVGLRYIHSDIVGSTGMGTGSAKPGQSFAGDISVYNQHKINVRTKGGDKTLHFKWGLLISNLGAKMNYSTVNAQKDFLPGNLKLGYALKYEFDEANSLMWTTDFNKLLVPSAGGTDTASVISGALSSFGDAKGGFSEEMSEINVSTGLEYNYDNTVFGRFGYFYEDPNKGNRKFFTVGAGIRFKVFSLDIAYLIPFSQDRHPLANTFRFSLNFNFGENTSKDNQ